MKCLYTAFLLNFFLTQPLLQQGQVTTISYNIRYDNPADGPDAWPERKAHVVEVLQNSEAGLMGLQEVLHHQLLYLDSALTDFAWVGVGRDDGLHEGEFNPILVDTTQFTILSDSTFWLSSTPHKPSLDWGAGCKRVCTWVDLLHKTSGDTLLMLNTHFDHQSTRARYASAELLCSPWGQGMFPQRKHKLLSGDFNTEIGEGGTHYTLGHSWDLPGPAYAAEGGHWGTFNAFDPWLLPTKRIDYIYSQGFTCVHYQHLDPRTPLGRCASDHLPVVARYQFKR